MYAHESDTFYQCTILNVQNWASKQHSSKLLGLLMSGSLNFLKHVARLHNVKFGPCSLFKSILAQEEWAIHQHIIIL